jgi:hypothetical protein
VHTGAAVVIRPIHKRAFFLLLLSLSVGTKLVLGAAARDIDDPTAAKEVISGFLSNRGFHVEANDQTNSPFVLAGKDKCRLLVAAVAPQGWDRDAIRQLSSQGDRGFFVVDGQVYEEQPVWRTWTTYYWLRLNRYLGRRRAVRHPLGAIASPDCNAIDLDWRGFRG